MPDLHAAVLKNFALKFGWVSTAEEVIAADPRWRRRRARGAREAAPGIDYGRMRLQSPAFSKAEAAR